MYKILFVFIIGLLDINTVKCMDIQSKDTIQVKKTFFLLPDRIRIGCIYKGKMLNFVLSNKEKQEIINFLYSHSVEIISQEDPIKIKNIAGAAKYIIIFDKKNDNNEDFIEIATLSVYPSLFKKHEQYNAFSNLILSFLESRKKI